MLNVWRAEQADCNDNDFAENPVSQSLEQPTKEEMLRSFRTQEILEAARRVIGKMGYDEASMEKIAQEAGVAKGTLYLYFENKETLLARAFEAGHRELMEELVSRVDNATTCTEKLRAVIRMALTINADRHGFFAALSSRPDLGRFGKSVASEQIRRQIHEFGSFVSRLLTAGCDTGEFRKHDTARVAHYVTELLCSILSERIETHQDSTNIEQEVTVLMDFILNGIAA